MRSCSWPKLHYQLDDRAGARRAIEEALAVEQGHAHPDTTFVNYIENILRNWDEN